MQVNLGATGETFHASFPYNPALIKKLKETFSNVRWDARLKRWDFPVNGRNFNRQQMETGGTPYLKLLSPIEQTSNKAKVVGDIRSDLPYFPHQELIYDFALTKQNCIIAAQMRTGKTRPVLGAVETFILTLPEAEREVWYIAPKSAIKGVRREYEKWFGVKFDKQGKILPRNRGSNQLPYKLMLITYTKWAAMLDERGIKELVPRVVVFDEIHKLKGHKSNVGKLSRSVWFAQAMKFGLDASMIIGMSGTPAPKNPADWWNMCECVAPGYLPYSSHDVMEQDLAYCIQAENENGQKFWKVEEWYEDKIEAFSQKFLVNKISLPIFKADVLDLPEKEHVYIELESSSDTKDAVEYLMETCKTKIELINKSRQISDGFLYDNVPDEVSGKNARTTDYLPTPKNEQLISDLADLKGRGIDRVVILAAYKASVDICADICISEGWETLRADGRGFLPLNTTKSEDDYLREFDRSTRTYTPNERPLAIVGHPMSVATGLELSSAPVMIYWSHTDNGEAEFQSIERAHSDNMDKELGLTIYHYCHLKVDRRMIENLVAKNTLQEITMGELLEDLKKERGNA